MFSLDVVTNSVRFATFKLDQNVFKVWFDVKPQKDVTLLIMEIMFCKSSITIMSQRRQFL